jgi:hypothetical protein
VLPNEERPKFEPLPKVLREQLSAVKVVKLGHGTEKTVFVVGKAADGALAAVKSIVVQT